MGPRSRMPDRPTRLVTHRRAATARPTEPADSHVGRRLRAQAGWVAVASSAISVRAASAKA